VLGKCNCLRSYENNSSVLSTIDGFALFIDSGSKDIRCYQVTHMLHILNKKYIYVEQFFTDKISFNMHCFYCLTTNCDFTWIWNYFHLQEYNKQLLSLEYDKQYNNLAHDPVIHCDYFDSQIIQSSSWTTRKMGSFFLQHNNMQYI